MKRLSLLLILIILMISACSPAPSTEQPTIAPTQTPRIVEVTKLVEVTRIVTATLEPTATVTPTPIFSVWGAEDVQTAILSAGLEYSDPREMTADDYGMAPMVADEAVRFLIPSLCADCGGRTFILSSQADLDSLAEYYNELSKASAMFFSWVFVKDNVLIQLNGSLPEETALKYQSALESMKK